MDKENSEKIQTETLNNVPLLENDLIAAEKKALLSTRTGRFHQVRILRNENIMIKW